MPLPVIDDVFRITINWSSGVGDPQMFSVFHLLTNGTASPTELAGWIDDDVDPGMFCTFDTALSANTMNILPLDGVTPTSVWPLTNWNGTHTDGDTVPGLGGVVSVRTSQRGPRGRGRLFLPALNEDAMLAGLIDDGLRDTTVDGWIAWADGLQGESGEVEWGVASYAYEEFNVVQSISMNALPGLIRSRRT